MESHSQVFNIISCNLVINCTSSDGEMGDSENIYIFCIGYFCPHVDVANRVEETLLADKKLCVSSSPSVLQVAQVGADNL